MKKGFTLIELLAVIIILAVIALIATPIVLNVVDNAKESARKSSVAGYADAVKLARTEAQFNNLPFNDNDLSDLSIETNVNNVNCSEVKFDTTLGIVLTGCYVGDYTAFSYDYSKGEVIKDEPDTNAPIVTTKIDTSDVTDEISSYFTYEKNGKGIITDIECTEGENIVTLVSLLSFGSHNITCTATKVNGMSSSSSTNISITDEVSNVVLAKFPELALADTVNKGCATSNNNYTYMGGCYLKGLHDDNYLWFNGFLYRIMGINKDGSIRLISEDVLTSITWGASNQTIYDYNVSYVKSWLNNYFLNINSTLNTENLVAQTFCSMRVVYNANIEDYNYKRGTCSTNCDTDPTKFVGLITLDEYNMAQSTPNTRSSYLVASDYRAFITMTPRYGDRYYGVQPPIGNVYSSLEYNGIWGIRPIINVKQDSIVYVGTGTISDYFVLAENKGTNDVTGTLIGNAKVGEYVKFADRIYRVTANGASGTKMVLDGFYDADNDNVLDAEDKYAYGEGGTTIPTCTLCSTINATSFQNWITNNDATNAGKLSSVTWYRGDSYNNGNYASSLNSRTNPYNGTTGLLRIGEILSGYSNSMTLNEYWLATPGSKNNYARGIMGQGGFQDDVINKYAVRPVINVNSSTSITRGNGTPNHPYEI